MILNYNILALDTSLKSCSVALLFNKKIYSLYQFCPKNHEKNIMNMIKKIFKICQTNMNCIHIIACTIGPGYFTGIRVTLSIAYALSIYYHLPLLSFSTLQIISEQIWNKYSIRKVIIALKISKNQILGAKFIKNKSNTWIGLHTEKMYKNKNDILYFLKKNKGIWAFVGNIQKKKKIKKISKKFLYTNIKNPHAKDIILYIQSQIFNKNKNIFFIKKLYPKYLCI